MGAVALMSPARNRMLRIHITLFYPSCHYPAAHVLNTRDEIPEKQNRWSLLLIYLPDVVDGAAVYVVGSPAQGKRLF